MTDTPSDDRYSLPPIEGLWEQRDAEESTEGEVEQEQIEPAGDPIAPLLTPPGLFARLETPPSLADDPDDHDPDDGDTDDGDTDDDTEFGDAEPVATPLVGVADAIDIVEQLVAQSASEAEVSEAQSGDEFVFAEAAEGIAAGYAEAEFDELEDYEADEAENDEPLLVEAVAVALDEAEPDEPRPLALPSYALLQAAAEQEEESQRTTALPMYGGDLSDDDEEILPHFLLEEAAPLDIVGAQEQLREIAQKNRRKADDEDHKPSLARTLAEIPILLLVAAGIAFLVKTFLAQAYYIPSGSMLPQLEVDDRVVVSKLAYKMHDPRRGDIVVFDDPRNGASQEAVVERTGLSKILRQVGEGVGVVQPSTDEFIKRVIALPGETVSGKDGFVYIDDRKLIEPYLPNGLETSDFPAQKVAAGKLWVMGDNRGGSADSRVFGQIEVDTIVGRAVVKVWPLSSLSFL
ncbi:MAG: signal peptidase I [Acidimicrobiales bacterium]|nr:signal peptidase I [Acidimicrobiales bacterium]